MSKPTTNHNLFKYFLTASEPQENETVQEIIAFMDEIPGGFLIYRADESEEIIYANKSLLRIFQCDTLEEFMEFTGKSFRGIVHPDDLADVEQSIQEQIADSQYDLDFVEYRIIRTDGEIRWPFPAASPQAPAQCPSGTWTGTG